MSIYIKISLGWYLLTSHPDYYNIIFSVASDSSFMLTSRISPQIIHHLLISRKLIPTSDEFELLSFITHSYFTVFIFLICCVSNGSNNRNTMNRFWMYVHHKLSYELRVPHFLGWISFLLCLYPHFVTTSYVGIVQNLGPPSLLIHVFLCNRTILKQNELL